MYVRTIEKLQRVKNATVKLSCCLEVNKRIVHSSHVRPPSRKVSIPFGFSPLNCMRACLRYYGLRPDWDYLVKPPDGWRFHSGSCMLDRHRLGSLLDLFQFITRIIARPSWRHIFKPFMCILANEWAQNTRLTIYV